MTFGERICRLRTARGLSQEELAVELQVSRQSVSKWETGGSVPELDKLLRLSEVFGVTLDELVKGAPAPEDGGAEEAAADGRAAERTEPPAAPEPARRGPDGIQRIVGVVLLGFAVLFGMLLPLLGVDIAAGLLAAQPFLLCGLVCLLVRRRAGLWCGWIWCALAGAYLRYATGISWTLVFQTIGYQPEWNYVRLAIAWAMLAALALLLAGTLWSFRALRITPTRRRLILLAAGWAAWLALPWLVNKAVFVPWIETLAHSGFAGEWRYTLANFLWGGLRFLALNVLTVCSLALRRGRRSAGGD